MNKEAEDNLIEEFVKCRAYWQRQFARYPGLVLVMHVHDHVQPHHYVAKDAEGLIAIVHSKVEQTTPETSFVEWCNGYGDCGEICAFPNDERPCGLYFEKVW